MLRMYVKTAAADSESAAWPHLDDISQSAKAARPFSDNAL